MSNASDRGVLWCQRHLLWMARFRSMEPRDVIANILHWTEQCYEHGTADEELQAGYHHYLSESGIGDGFANDPSILADQFREEIGRLDQAFADFKAWKAWPSDDEAVRLLEEFAFLVGAGDENEDARPG